MTEEKAKVESTFTGRHVKMGIDPAMMGHIMNMLSKQYSDPAMAVVREYSTNAIDAQIVQGWTRPIEITSPTWNNAVFSVQDFGVGMDYDDINEVYSFYGASTKRDTGLFNGQFGIGAKSAFAYTNQFTVESNKNGVKTIVIVSRDEEGGGDMLVVSEDATADPNGTKITVPVSDVGTFCERINTFATRLSPGLALVDGKDLSEWGTYDKVLGTVRDEDGNVVINGIYHTDKPTYASYAKDRVYMGGVSYPALNSISATRTSPPRNILVDVAIDKVKFTPSRESLEDTPMTRKTLELAGKKYVEHMVSTVKKQIVDADSILGAYWIYHTNANFLGGEKVDYSGVDLSSVRNVVSHLPEYTRWYAFYSDGTEARHSNAERASSMNITAALSKRQVVFVRGFENKNGVAASYKKKMQHWAKNHFVAPKHWNDPVGIPDYFYLFDEVPTEFTAHPILKDIEWVEWEDIKAVKLPAQPKAASTSVSTIPDGTRLVASKGEHGFIWKDVDAQNAKKIYYVIGTELKEALRGRGTTIADCENELFWHVQRFLETQPDDTIVVNLYKRSENKFTSEYPDAIRINTLGEMSDPFYDNLLDEFKDYLDEWAAEWVMDNSRIAKTIYQVIRRAGASRVLDPRLVDIHNAYNKGVNVYSPLITKRNALIASPKHLAEAEKLLEDASAKHRKSLEDAETCYPMLTMVDFSYYGPSSDEAEIILDYLNTAYDKEN